MPTRLMHEEFCVSESVARCTPKAQDAFPRFILAADSFGVLQVNAKALKGRLWPLRDDVKPADITRWIREYQAHGMLQIWDQDGKTYAVFTNWGKFQRIDPRLHRKYPEPPTNIAELPGNTGNHKESQENTPPVSVSVSYSVTDSVTDTDPRARERAEAGFTQFWHTYPVKKAKEAARRAWRKLQPSEQLQAAILASLERAKTSAAWLKDGGQYIPHASTWLNGKRWEDEAEPALVGSPGLQALHQLRREEGRA